MSQTRRHPNWIWAAVALLALLHQDFWWWSSRALVFGFLPIGLAYHAVFSLAAAGIWALACRWAWPDHIEQWANETDSNPSQAHPAQQEEAP